MNGDKADSTFSLRKFLLNLLRYTRANPAPFFTFLVILIDPFGLSQSTDTQSKHTSYRITAASYPDTSRDQITTILIDDVSVTKGSTAFDWPPKFYQYEDLLRAITTYNPAAIFLDIVFLDERGSSSDLERFGKYLSSKTHGKNPVPIYAMGGQTIHFNGDKCEIEELQILPDIANSVTNLPYFRYSGFGEDYPLYIQCDDQVLLSPAAMIMQEICAENSRLQIDCALPRQAELRKNTKWIDDFPPTMSVRWGDGTTDFNWATYYGSPGNKTPCIRDNEGFWSRIKHISATLLDAFSGQFEFSLPSKCYYHSYVSAAKLVNWFDTALRSEDIPARTDRDQKLRQLLENRVVMVGMDLAAVKDTVISPVQGTLPGVTNHAMALDNLLTLGNKVQRPPPDFLLAASWADVIEFLPLLVLFFLQYRLDSRVSLGPDTQFGNFITVSLATLTVTVGAMYLTAFILNWTPLNWLGLIGIWLTFVAFHYSRTRLANGLRSDTDAA